MKAIDARLRKLEAATPGHGCPECSGPLVREIIDYCPDFGDSEPAIPVCPKCGQPRDDVLILKHVIVNSREDVKR
jgi:hypothetical protein